MLKDWLKLLHVKFISRKQKRALVEYFGTPQNLFQTSVAMVEESGIISAQNATSLLKHPDSVALDDCQRLADLGAGFIEFSNKQFSTLLNQIPDPPLGLFYRGNLGLLDLPQIAIVGSRNASPSGRKTTASLATGLSSSGFVITSGMASGIDSFAHQAMIQARGHTIAVLGTGIDQCYPKSNQSLFEEIVCHGLVISEYSPLTPPRKANFPQRNRIISGLSIGTVVVEAGLRSGSLITARLAADQGREVFAVPGSIYQQTSRGCHYLIRQGAKLTECVNDILEELPVCILHSASPEPSQIADSRDALTQGEILIYNLIDYAPNSFDNIFETSRLTVEEVSYILMQLELRGLIEQTIGGYQRIP